MKIKLKLVGFPETECVIGGKEIVLEVEGNTFGDLLCHLEKNFGGVVARNLTQQILKNGKEWIRRDDLTHPLQNGNQLTFLRMMGGG